MQFLPRPYHRLGTQFPFLLGPAEEVDDTFSPTRPTRRAGMTMNLEASNRETSWGTVQVEYPPLQTGMSIITPDQRLITLPLQ
jgi:hypothetical protein